jgi:hypothetical protein
VLKPLDIFLLARVLLPGFVQLRRRGLPARAELDVLPPAEVILAGRLGGGGQPLLDRV